MPSIEFQFNAEGFARALKKYPEDVTKELRRANKRSAALVESHAKANHRFTTRTGRLVKSIKGFGGVGVEQVKRKGFFGRVADAIFGKGGKVEAYVNLVLFDEGTALGTKYGKYVHNGQRSWGADKFIEAAVNENYAQIENNWQRAIDKANKEF